QGDGTLVLGADNSYSGLTTVTAGGLHVAGAILDDVRVDSGARLSGNGTVGGHVEVADGGQLLGSSGDTLQLGSLALSGNAQVNVTLGAPSEQTLFDVAGDLTLDGVLNVGAGEGFGTGVYRLFDYGGSLTDNGMLIGSQPAGTSLTL